MRATFFDELIDSLEIYKVKHNLTLISKSDHNGRKQKKGTSMQDIANFWFESLSVVAGLMFILHF